jgi:phage gp45-like
VALLFNPSYRFGNQAQGESTAYAPDGTRAAVRVGGIIHIIAGNQVTIEAPSAIITSTGSVTVSAPSVTVTATESLTLTAPTVTVQGNLQVDGAINATGEIHGA